MSKVYQKLIKKYSPKAELALKLGKSRSFIDQLQSGRKNPSIKTLEDLAAVFKVSVPYLLRERDDNEATTTATQDNTIRTS